MKKLENEVIELKYQVNVLQSLLSVRTVPIWAEKAIEAAEKSGVAESHVGNSLDFYRIIDLLLKKGIL
ncbi:hypothetical protein ACN9MH_03130 [Paenibacillus silvae]|uniref:hypothetical protein n=1 Tax=Paenibacillus TaxID=44249 RepID=UPI001C10CD53|nr:MULTISPECIES: hypothetical protein [Paenibacillus]MBU5356057.1 hypothetical protein [Paenibacillus barcinonensis]MDM5280069.1 hypothetical protein [Paenibacillus silvae]